MNCICYNAHVKSQFTNAIVFYNLTDFQKYFTFEIHFSVIDVITNLCV